VKTAVLAAIAALYNVVQPATAGDDCRLERYASLPMTVDTKGTVEAPVEIAGHTVALQVDTGGISSLLTSTTVDALGLKRLPAPPSETTVLYGGTRLSQFVMAPDVAFDSLAPVRKRFVVVPDGRLPRGADGTMASDMLSAMDVDFDFGAGRLNFYGDVSLDKPMHDG
jgi:Aspartyl protease